MTQDKRGSFLCETNSTTSHMERTHRASTDTRLDGCGTLCRGDFEWYRQQVSKMLIIKVSGYLGLAAHHKREMRILSRVLTWIPSEAGRAEMITYEGNPRTRGRLVAWLWLEAREEPGEDGILGRARVLGKKKNACRSLPAN